jgi:transcription elongation GreA/GreB family factor
MDKTEIINKIKEILKTKLNDLNQAVKEARESAKQAPSAMESHSDTSRFQFSQLADNLEEISKKVQKVIDEISKTKSNSEIISEGSLVKIEKNGQNIFYFLSSMSLEDSFLIDGSEFRVISTETPIAKSLFEKKAGDLVEINLLRGGYKIKVIEVF